MEHVLDNPAWNALISGNKNLAKGNDFVKYFDDDVSPYVAFKENTIANFNLLHDFAPVNRPYLFVTPGEIEIPDNWKILNTIKGLQMVCNTPKPHVRNPDINVVDLTTEHVPQMLALTKLTNPGPFATRTIEFGHYQGVFAGDKLVAMVGQRLYPQPYAEVSAVCTHPDYVGKGYARELLIRQIGRIKAAANIPILHVRDDNERAIKVYESLGFATRIAVTFYVILKNG
jgi:ribosomal protein S18 acetylase RimI-like enzyme